MTAEEVSLAIVSGIVRARTIVSVLYIGVGAVSVASQVSGHNILLAASI